MQTEIALAADKVSYSGDDPEFGAYAASFESYSLRIPLLLRLTWNNPLHISENVSIGLIAGIGFNAPLGAMQLQSSVSGGSSYRLSMPMSYVIGINPGIRLGPGLLFADVRFSGDFAKTAIHDHSGTLAVYTRNTLSFSLGYEFAVNR